MHSLASRWPDEETEAVIGQLQLALEVTPPV
jgi:hypothetical protein